MRVVISKTLLPLIVAIFLASPSLAFLALRPTAPHSLTELHHNKKKKGSTAAKGFGASSSSSSVNKSTRATPIKIDRFPYAGALRPGKQSKQKIVTVDSILKPDYAKTGMPQRVDKPMFPWMIEVKNAQDIEKMRAAGSLARDILDLAGQAVQVGVTTDEIDELVHSEIIKVSFGIIMIYVLGISSPLFNRIQTSRPCFLLRTTTTARCVSIAPQLSRLSQKLLYQCERSHLSWYPRRP